MQKRIFTFLFLIATVLSYSTFAEAALQFLPRYQGGYGVRTQDGGRDKVTITCSSRGGYAKGANQTCTGMFMVSGLTCYKNCSCNNGYKANASSSGCVAKTCSDYSLKSSPDATMSCTSVSKAPNLTCQECVACDSSTYKYSCSGGLNASTQGTGNKCGINYSECSCVEHASWNSNSGKCECGSDYKAGTTSCTLRTCEDYGYSATEDTTKNCTKQTPRSGLTCWNCSDCTGTLYDCGSITNASGGSGTACGGKYPQCTCKDLYRWDNGTCKLNCTRNSCSTTTYPLTAQNAANASSYEKCTPSCSDESPRYKVAGCNSGYNVNSNGSGCEAAPAKTCEKGYALINGICEKISCQYAFLWEDLGCTDDLKVIDGTANDKVTGCYVCMSCQSQYIWSNGNCYSDNICGGYPYSNENEARQICNAGGQSYNIEKCTNSAYHTTTKYKCAETCSSNADCVNKVPYCTLSYNTCLSRIEENLRQCKSILGSGSSVCSSDYNADNSYCNNEKSSCWKCNENKICSGRIKDYPYFGYVEEVTRQGSQYCGVCKNSEDEFLFSKEICASSENNLRYQCFRHMWDNSKNLIVG